MSDANEQINPIALQQGECMIENITLVNQFQEAIDLTFLTSSVRLFEGIDRMYVSGRLSIVDSLNLAKNFRITGQESLTIRARALDMTDQGDGKFAKPPNTIDRVFRVTGITNEQPNPAQTSKNYIINFINPLHFMAQQFRIDRALRGSYSDMLASIWLLEVHKGKIKDIGDITDFWEDTFPSTYQFNPPNMNINEIAQYIVESGNAEGSTFKNSMFFFDTVMGRQRFMSYDTMRTLKLEIPFDTYPRNSDFLSSETNIDAPYLGLNTQIMAYEKIQKSDTMGGQMEGVYASKIRTYDPVRKLEKINNFKIGDAFKNSKETDYHPLVKLSDGDEQVNDVVYKASLFNDDGEISLSEDYVLPALDSVLATDSAVHYKVDMTNAYSPERRLIDSTTATELSSTWIGDEYKDNAFLQRNSLLGQLAQNVIRIKIPFRPDIFAGTMIRLNFQGAELTDGPAFDETDNGYYLITRVTYNIEPLKNAGTIGIECVKDSSAIKIDDYKPLETASQPQEDASER